MTEEKEIIIIRTIPEYSLIMKIGISSILLITSLFFSAFITFAIKVFNDGFDSLSTFLIINFILNVAFFTHFIDFNDTKEVKERVRILEKLKDKDLGNNVVKLSKKVRRQQIPVT